MTGQSPFLCKCFVTLITLVRFLSTMYSEMTGQMMFECQFFVTLITLVRFLSTMYSDMIGQLPFLCKSFITLITMKWLLSSVCSEMQSQSMFGCKCFVTLITMKWFFSWTVPIYRPVPAVGYIEARSPTGGHGRQAPEPADQWYRSGTVNSNTVNLKFHLIRSFFEIFATFLSFHV